MKYRVTFDDGNSIDVVTFNDLECAMADVRLFLSQGWTVKIETITNETDCPCCDGAYTGVEH